MTSHYFKPQVLNADGQAVVEGMDDLDADEKQNILSKTWTVWFLHRGPGVKISNYLRATSNLGSVSTVQQFWRMYSHLTPINKLPVTSEFLLFRYGVNPVWEDPINITGGKWVVHLKRPSNKRAPATHAGTQISAGINGVDETNELSKSLTQSQPQPQSLNVVRQRHLAALAWEHLLLSVIGGEFVPEGLDADEIVGVVVSVRRDEDILSVWNRSLDESITSQIKKALQTTLKDVLGIESVEEENPYISMEYKIHAESIKEGAEKQASYEQRHHHHHHHSNHHNSHNNHSHHPHSTSHHSQHQHHNTRDRHNHTSFHSHPHRPLHAHSHPHPNPHSVTSDVFAMSPSAIGSPVSSPIRPPSSGSNVGGTPQRLVPERTSSLFF